MNDIPDILRELLDRYDSLEVVEQTFKQMTHSDDQLATDYRQWCRAQGYSVRNGCREYINELVDSRDSIWDNYKEYGNDI